MSITFDDLTDLQKLHFLRERIKRDVSLYRLYIKKTKCLTDVEKSAIENLEIANVECEPNLEDCIN